MIMMRRKPTTCWSRLVLVLLTTTPLMCCSLVHSFVPLVQRPRSRSIEPVCLLVSQERRRVTTTTTTTLSSSTAAEHNNNEAAAAAADATAAFDNDTELLASVTQDQLLALCRQCNIDATADDDKPLLLQRLRQHAAEQAEAAKERLARRRADIQDGGAGKNDKERYERSDEETTYGVPEEEDEPFFFFEDPHLVVPESAVQTKDDPDLDMPLTSGDITSPPFPKEPNADGERVVKLYSTTDQNDLTGIAASQPGNAGPHNAANGDLSTTMGTTTTNQPWEATAQQRTTTHKDTTTAATEAATAQVTELVAGLLASTRAPGFIQDDDDDELSSLLPTSMPRTTTTTTFFDPSTVPSDLLDSCATSLRTGRGQVLHDVLYEFELRAVGYDGMAGDDTTRGGGHYQAVQHVRAFLDGYRKSQVRSFARETATLLLDKLVQEGVNGLDMTLATMGRSNDDVAEGGELNESLMDFLNDMIRQQEKKVDRLVSERMDAMERSVDATFTKTSSDGSAVEEDAAADPMDQFWNVTTTDEGNRVETLDPNDPQVKQVLEEELERTNADAVRREKIPDTAPEQLLLLLTLLRERIKVEVSFVMDEKSRNLRLLAYCLRLGDDQEREQLILNQLGKSLDVSTIDGVRCLSTSCYLIFLSLHSSLSARRGSTLSLNWYRARSSMGKVLRTSCNQPRNECSMYLRSNIFSGLQRKSKRSRQSEPQGCNRER